MDDTVYYIHIGAVFTNSHIFKLAIFFNSFLLFCVKKKDTEC
jgi:hypothetical protein